MPDFEIDPEQEDTYLTLVDAGLCPMPKEWVCEWCEPSDVPQNTPERCRVMYCEKHKTRTWHYYRKEATDVHRHA